MTINNNIFNSLEIIRNKGNCFATIERAYKELIKLDSLISESEYTKISIALAHKRIGDSDTELNDVLKEITPKYTGK